MVRTLFLEEVMKTKIEAFLNRKEIRDVFDIEFLLKKGVPLNAKKEELQQLLEGIKDFSKNDYSVKLGSIVDAEWRNYYIKENFKILVMKLKEILGGGL
ncbi:MULTISPECIES: nucleotidyl transferase AbiEii/AbiGii toxin family protein [Thermodesulfovibrio]|uniref:nucleotidyl transferase AbiEii/AbiGii toxin family protein n=1 Tax=Thermodesulfovibrio TaxID=28261 RepID=UPI0021060470|nr:MULTISPECIES: nucleotidyl transferase AbiEii/AbiGii toxin family protein [Thermodesulfovibrio]MDI6864523.1 nucleotidyl transferase AbiEii/AbiGii toxin family protein [Thermodesulfovibrio yellowstonii]